MTPISKEDIIKQRILKNIDKYYSVENVEESRIRTIPNTFHSQNRIYLFEVIIDKAQKKMVVAKETLSQVSKEGGKREYDTLKALYGNEEMKKQNCTVPYPLDYFEDISTMLTEKVDAESISCLLRKKNSFFSSAKTSNFIEQTITKCGKCLKIFHNINTIRTTDSFPQNLFEELFDKINNNYNELLEKEVVLFDDKDFFQKTMHNSKEWIKGRKVEIVKQHGDYWPVNILLKDNQLVLLDFTFSKENTIFNDISCFLRGLDMLNPYPRNFFYNFARVELLKKRFLEGYFTDLAEINDSDRFFIHLYAMRNILIHCNNRYRKLINSGLKGNLLFFFYIKIYRKKLKHELKYLAKFF